MKNTTILVIVVLILVAGGGFIFAKSGNLNVAENTNTYGPDVDTVSGDVQKVNLGIKNYNYYPNTITVKVGKPVSITLDKSVVGCYRSFTIRDLGVNKYSSNPSQTIDFTPTKTGTFRFACSMGMGTGTIIVED
ncbi:cupredoxin domain-containing protein [Candidatus Pacearchaeota archaeon]|nr:cupredoxin domain-containing protein [Candidatus Pacearchaeota archaeon]